MFRKILSKEYAPSNYISKRLVGVKSTETFTENFRLQQTHSNKHLCDQISLSLDHQQSDILFGPHISHMPFNNNLIVIIITICSRKVRIYMDKLIPRNIILEMV